MRRDPYETYDVAVLNDEHGFSSWASSAPLLKYFGSRVWSSSYSHGLTSVLYATPNCNFKRLAVMLHTILPDGHLNDTFIQLLREALRLDTSRYRVLPSAFTFYRFVVSAIAGMVEQNNAHPTDYPKPMAEGWPLLGLCRVLNEDSGRELTQLEYIQELMPRVVGLYYNATGQTSEYCIEPRGGLN